MISFAFCAYTLFPSAFLLSAGLAVESPAADNTARSEQATATLRWRLVDVGADRDADKTASALIHDADVAEDKLEEYDRRLMAANWILSRQIEPAASRLLLNLVKDGDAAKAGSAVAVAQLQLDRAQKLWHELAEEETPTPDNRRRRAESRESLSAFAAVFAAIWPVQASSEKERNTALREAASGLAVVLESEKSHISAAAMLWQAYLYHRRDRVKRALDLLPMVLKPLEGEGVYGFYARLLRSRYIAQSQEGYATAIALLIRMGAQSEGWFEDVIRKRLSRHTSALIRRQITEQWAAVFRERQKTAQATWCDHAIARIDMNYFSDDQPTDLLRLEFAIPVMVKLPNTDY